MGQLKSQLPLTPWMVWSDLWPAQRPHARPGWSEQLRPGVSVLLDETAEEAHEWLAVLAGHALPARGRVQCAGLCSRADSAAYQAQVYWHKPHIPASVREAVAQQWVSEVAEQWPLWSDEAWQRHSEGLGLTPHLDKPMWHLSTGSLRKLGIAAALASGARLTLIEEPVAALDHQSVLYLSQALDALGEELAEQPDPPRWVIVAHWEPLPGVTWDEVLAPPALELADAAASAGRAVLPPDSN